MVVALTFLVTLAPHLLGHVPTQSAAPLVRVFIQTDDKGDADELEARRSSVADLAGVLGAKRKTIALVSREEEAHIVVEVLSRGVTVPKVVMGLGARPGQPPETSAGPVRNAVLRVRLTFGDQSTVFTNKNKASDSPRGWKSAAEDIGSQIETWIAKDQAAVHGR